MTYPALNADQRGGARPTGKPSLTLDEAAAKLTREGASWSSGLGQPAVVTYSFRDTEPDTMPDGVVGFQRFNSQQIAATERALKLWSDVADITFVKVEGPGLYGWANYSDDATILFSAYTTGKEGWGGFAYFPGSRSSASAAGDVWINSSLDYMRSPDRSRGGFAALLHEIGHAIGLSHPSDYDAGATRPTYAADASYNEDSLEYSIMSYFSLTNTGGSIASDLGPITPLMDDIVAAQRLYGANMRAAAGNNLYGATPTPTPGLSTENSFYGNLAPYGTIWDAGGIDWLDYTRSDFAERIDLRPGTFSDVQGAVGTLSIAPGVIIENAIGGNANDTITGNEADNQISGNDGADALRGEGGNDVLTGGAGADRLTGGAGSDRFQDSTAGLAGDTIDDFSPADRIVFTDAPASSFAFSLSASTLTFAGGSLTLQDLPAAALLVASAQSAGGIQLRLATRPVGDDFNGDGHSDILWRSESGALSNWLGQANGGFLANDSNAFSQVATNWQIVGTGDFNGDRRDDILWRSDDGSLSNWLGQTSGGFGPNDANALSQVATNWRVVGTGDFNGDGREDLLWRNDAGVLSDWLGQASGGFGPNDANAMSQVSTGWQVVGTGDFNGDGRADILWRSETGQLSDWLGQANGGFIANDANALLQVATNWHVIGTADFDGDGRDDILWRSDTGQLSDWLGQPNGGFAGNDASAMAQVPLDWQVANTGDFNGDGRDDILWRNMGSGNFSDWLGQANGGFAGNDANALVKGIPLNWHIQAFDSFRV